MIKAPLLPSPWQPGPGDGQTGPRPAQNGLPEPSGEPSPPARRSKQNQGSAQSHGLGAACPFPCFCLKLSMGRCTRRLAEQTIGHLCARSNAHPSPAHQAGTDRTVPGTAGGKETYSIQSAGPSGLQWAGAVQVHVLARSP